MRAFKLILKSILAVAGVFLASAVLLLVVFGWSSSNVETANAECSMLILEKKIEPANRETEYWRACMASKGYRIDPSCYVNNYTSASCFVPRWMIWRNSI